eukprot:2211745-Prymnesium_polylepis.1
MTDFNRQLSGATVAHQSKLRRRKSGAECIDSFELSAGRAKQHPANVPLNPKAQMRHELWSVEVSTDCAKHCTGSMHLPLRNLFVLLCIASSTWALSVCSCAFGGAPERMSTDATFRSPHKPEAPSVWAVDAFSAPMTICGSPVRPASTAELNDPVSIGSPSFLSLRRFGIPKNSAEQHLLRRPVGRCEACAAAILTHRCGGDDNGLPDAVYRLQHGSNTGFTTAHPVCAVVEGVTPPSRRCHPSSLKDGKRSGHENEIDTGGQCDSAVRVLYCTKR